MIEYPQIRSLPEAYLREKIREFLAEDMPYGDITSLSTMPEGTRSRAELNAREDIVLAGMPVLACIFEDKASVQLFRQDGEKVKAGETIALIEGDSRILLGKERVALNLLQRMSAIATTVSRYVEIARPYGVKILDTRKTTPGLRLFEKYAVAAGGGHNHRMDLSSGMLIKDNHVRAAGGISAVLENVRNSHSGLPVQLEVDDISQIREAMLLGIDGFLLDNMDPARTREAVKEIRKGEAGRRIFIESSGGISLSNLALYTDTGIDAVSSGALTHSCGSVDLGLDFS